MRAKVYKLNGDMIEEDEKEFTNFSIKKDDNNGVSFSVKINDIGMESPPHLGIVHFRNIKSKLLNDTLKLLYRVVGMLTEDYCVRNVYAGVGEIDKVRDSVIEIEQKINKHKKVLERTIEQLKYVENLPEPSEKIKNKLDKLREILEEQKLKMRLIKERDEYIEQSKKLRIVLKEVNSLVDLVNDKRVRKLNLCVIRSREEMILEKLNIEKQIEPEKLKAFYHKNGNMNDDLVYITKKLELEEDYEL